MPCIITPRRPPAAALTAVDWSTAAETTIVASDAATNDHFGRQPNADSSSAGPVYLSRNGQYLFISAVDNDVTFGAQGRVYVYEKSGGVWTEKQILDSPNPAAGERFGYNITTSNNGAHVLIGTGQHKFHYFQLITGSWVHQQTIEDHEAGPASFGQSLDISSDGTVALVGNSTFNSSIGKAYIFTNTGGSPQWTLTQEIDPPNPKANGKFGGSFVLSPDGTHAVIGQPDSTTPGGRAHAFANVGGSPMWSETQEITPSVVQTNQVFGRGRMVMSSDGNTIIVAAAWKTSTGSPTATFVGAGYVFTYSGGVWTEQQILEPSDGELFGFGIAGDHAGASISNDGSTVVLGSYNQTSANGAIYIFTGTPGSYIENAKIVPSVSEANQSSGKATMIRNNNEIFSAAENRDVTVTDQGVVYVYTA